MTRRHGGSRGSQFALGIAGNCPRGPIMRIPITFNSSVATNNQPDTGSASSPVMDSVQECVESHGEKHLKSDSISRRAPHEPPSKAITPIQRIEIVGVGGDGERYLVHAADLTDMGSCRKFEAMLDYCFDRTSEKPGSTLENVPELLDFSIDLEQMLANGESLQQDRPKGTLLNFELPPHMKTSSGDNSQGPAKVIEFRRPQSFNGSHSR